MNNPDDSLPRPRFVEGDDKPQPVRKLRYPHAPPPMLSIRMPTISGPTTPSASAVPTEGKDNFTSQQSCFSASLSNPSSSGDNTKALQSALSPYAKEFVPRQNPVYTVFDSVNYPSSSSEAYNTSFTQGSYSQSHNIKPFTLSDRLKVGRRCVKTPEQIESYMLNSNVDSTGRLIAVIDQLHLSNANFDNIRTTIEEIFSAGASDVDFLDRAVKLLINEAVRKPNFQYSCARLCVLIDERAPTFHSMLFEQCAQLYLQYVSNLNDNRNYSGMLGLLSTSSELIFNFGRERNLSIENLVEFAELIYKVIDTVIAIKHDNETNIKTVCQALKLSGYYLQLTSSKNMDKLLHRLQEEAQRNGSKVLLYVQSVHNLSASGWGYLTNNTNVDKQEEEEGNHTGDSCLTDRWEYPDYDPQVGDIDDTVYYGPDGKVLTAEETSFLYCNLNDSSDKTEGDDDDALWDPENELGPEIQKAFKDFLQYSKNKPN